MWHVITWFADSPGRCRSPVSLWKQRGKPDKLNRKVPPLNCLFFPPQLISPSIFSSPRLFASSFFAGWLFSCIDLRELILFYLLVIPRQSPSPNMVAAAVRMRTPALMARGAASMRRPQVSYKFQEVIQYASSDVLLSADWFNADNLCLFRNQLPSLSALSRYYASKCTDWYSLPPNDFLPISPPTTIHLHTIGQFLTRDYDW